MKSAEEKSEIRRELLHRLTKAQLEEANEAQTRLYLIDRVLFELLDWTHDDVTPEERVDNVDGIEFTDYSVRTVNSGLVIEAKRVGASQFPLMPTRRLRLGSIAKDQPSLWKIIEKARAYALSKSIPFACVTNGDCWVIFPASRVDSLPWLDSSAVIFDGLQSVLGTDWPEFASLLSRDSVISASLELALLGTESDQVDDRRLKNFFSGARGAAKHNSIFELIRAGVDVAFSDANEWEDVDALRRCYVQTPDRQRFDNRIRMAISRPDAVVRRHLDGVSPAGFDKSKQLLTSSRAPGTRSLALLVLGSVGAGKTTFLHYFRKVGAAEYFAATSAALSPLWIWIDFRAFGESAEFESFVANELFSYVVNDDRLTDSSQIVRPAFKGEIEGLKRSLAAFGGAHADLDSRVLDLLTAEYTNKASWAERILRFASTKVPVYVIS